MNSIQKLRQKFEQDKQQIQDNCSHTKVEILPYMWAPGHFFGKNIVCVECEKVLKHIDDNFYKVKITTSP
jgi:hypothetical protein